MTRFAPFVILILLAGCLDTNIQGDEVGTGTSGTATVTGGSGAQPSSSGSSSGGNVGGNTGSSSGGSTIGGTTGGADLTQMCTDFVAGAEHVDQCDGSTGPFGTVQQCEAALAVCTAQDDQLLDGAGLCLQAVACNSANLESSVLFCASGLAGLSAACYAAATAGAGGQPP